MAQQLYDNSLELMTKEQMLALMRENEVLREEIRVSRESAEITASLVVRQFEETEKILMRFQVANAQRKAVLDSAEQMAIIATNKNGVIIVFNKGAENLLGYDAKEVIGKITPEVFHLKSELDMEGEALSLSLKEEVIGLDVFWKYAKHGITSQQEWTYVKKDGTRLPVSMSINSLYDPEGNVGGFLCIASDITDKKRSEKALKESERNYRLLINNIPNIVFKGYADGSIEFFDDKIEKLTGYKREVFLSGKKIWTDLIVEEDREGTKKKFLSALKSEKSYIREYRIRKKNGDIVWLEAGSQIICNKKGEIEFVTGAFLDISERKQAEQALFESEEKYRSLFDSGPNPIFVLDMETLHILDANPSAEETYGYTKNELLGKSFTELGEFEDEKVEIAQFHLPSMNDGAFEQSCFVSQRARHLKKDRTPFFLRVKGCPIHYKGKMAIILAVTDITELVEKDAQLFQASKMTTLGEMSAGIAHELNQPLNAIKIGNEFLKLVARQGKQISKEKLIKVTTHVTEQVDRASDIINELRDFGRVPDFKREKVNINDSIRKVLSIIGQQFILQNIHVKLDLDESLPFILASHNRLEQIVFNMLTNARDAIEQKSEIHAADKARTIAIRSFTEDGDAAFTISDTGVGIPKGILDKIYEPFFTTKEVGKGMGLGLSIVYGIVRSYGGKVEIETTEGEGTCFKYWFPSVSI